MEKGERVMDSQRLLSVNVSQPKNVRFLQNEIYSGIDKKPVSGDVYLSRINLEGDAQADLRFHGGPDKAICVYSFDHFSFWEDILGIKLVYGAFGENLTVKGMTEEEVCIGDIFTIGDAILQITQPRQPCYKLSNKLGFPRLPKLVQHTGYTGFYCRVLKEGIINAEDDLKLAERHKMGITVSFANKIKYRESDNMAGIEKILAVPELSHDWRNQFEQKLIKLMISEKELMV